MSTRQESPLSHPSTKEEKVPKRAKKKTSEEDEIDALVDDLDEIEDEDVEADDDDEVEDDDEDEEDDDEDEDEDDDPDEAPAKAKKSKKGKKSKPKASSDGVGTSEVAEAAGIDSRSLRMFLRAKGYQPKDDRDGRYHWKSLNDKEVQRILKQIQGGAVDKMNKEKLDNLKSKKTSKKSASKKASAKKKKAKASK